MREKGIVIAGSIIADIVKNIEQYPEIGTLAYVSDISMSVGGCVSNTAIDLKKMDETLSISAAGRIGQDENGSYIIAQLKRYGIDVDMIRVSDHQTTSFSDVMSIPSGERTFFHKRGANAEFAPEDIAPEQLNCDLLHIGYLLLLDRFDASDEEYGTVMARFLHEVQKMGIKTSIDVVSDNNADFGRIIIPALKYCNYVIINEIECCNIWKVEAYHEDGRIHRDHIRLAMTRMVEAGVADKVVIHSKTVSFVLDAATAEFTEVPSLRIPEQEIKGSVGAGDAFCAGCLYGLYHGYSDRQMLEYASAAAACSLMEANAVDGMKTKAEIQKVLETYERLSAE